MRGSCSGSRVPWLRFFGIWIATIAGGCALPLARAQNLDKPIQSIDKDVTAFAYAPDGRIVYSVNQTVKTKQYELEHDDIWIQESNGKSRRILQGEKFNRGNQPFSYIVDSFRWSPDGRMILAQLFTSTVDDAGKTSDSYMTLVLEDNGKEIRIAGGDSLIKDAANPTWLPDNATILYLNEAVKPRALFSIKSTNRATGAAPSLHEGRTFRDVSWLPNTNTAIAVEQNQSMTGPLRLQQFDLVADTDAELATLDTYAGGLTISPRGAKAAYFIDKEVLEVRDLADPTRLARLRVGFGTFRWAPDESRIFIKRATEKKSGDIVFVDVPPLSAASDKAEIPVLQPANPAVLHGLTFRDFAISPNGQNLAVVATGTRNLLVFPLPR